MAYAILLYEGIVTEDEYQKRLHALFLEQPDNDMLLDLECETDIHRTILYIRTRIDYLSLDVQKFGAVLMGILRDCYTQCSDLRRFGKKLYSIWESLPGYIQNEEPFWSLCYADDFPHWNDEAQTMSFFEIMLSYYEEETEG